jgi:DNA-binding beta-propeller fold protein YncE
VACHDADRVAVLSSTGGLVRTISPGYGSTPIGVAITPDGTSAFVTLMGKGELKRYSVSSGAETGTIALGPTPRAIAITGDGTRVLVTRFLADLNHGMVWDVANGTNLTLNRTYRLVRDRSGDGASNGRGIPNQLTGITISPDGAYAWVTGTKHNDQHGTLFTGAATTDNVARALIVRLRLSQNEEEGDSKDRLDVDNSDSPTSVVFSPRGDWAFTTLQGNNEIGVFDDISIRAGGGKATKWRFGSDLAPQGMVFDSNTNKLFVNNFMARNVTVHDLSGFFASGSRAMNAPKVNVVATEKLSADILAGKQIFYNASRKNAANEFTMSRDSYISCATCHLDGGQDGRVWDFTQRGEGLRNSIDLRGKSGMGHGNLHWSANFDEVQDFENDVRSHFGGAGLISGSTISTPLGTGQGRREHGAGSIGSLRYEPQWITHSGEPTSRFGRNTDRRSGRGSGGVPGSELRLVPQRHEVYRLGRWRRCVRCPARRWNPPTTSGKGNNTTLTGIDTPTLLGVHNSGPYFHEGSARTLEAVFSVAGGKTYQAESASRSGSVGTSRISTRTTVAAVTSMATRNGTEAEQPPSRASMEARPVAQAQSSCGMPSTPS